MRHGFRLVCGMVLAAGSARSAWADTPGVASASAAMHAFGEFAYSIAAQSGYSLSITGFRLTGSMAVAVGAAQAGNDCPCEACDGECLENPTPQTWDITSGSAVGSMSVTVPCVGGAADCQLGYSTASGSYNQSAWSGGMNWQGTGQHTEDWSKVCGEDPSWCSFDSSVRLCKSFVGDWTFGDLDTTSSKDGEVDLIFGALFNSVAGGYSTNGSCTDPASTIVPPVLHAGKSGRISTAITIERLSIPSGTVVYSKSVSIVTTVWHSATSIGGCNQSNEIVLDPEDPQSDTYVTVDLGSADIDANGCNSYCSHVYVPGSGSSYDSHLRIQVGKTASTSERWRVTLYRGAEVQDLPSGDVAGSGPERACASGVDCDLPGDQPDGQINLLDLRAVYASAGTVSTDCAYVQAVDLDGNGTIDASTEAMASRCWEMLDVNGDGFVDFNDAYDYSDLLGVGDCRADVNGDGFLDFFDYDEYMLLFENGLPECASAHSQPPSC